MCACFALLSMSCALATLGQLVIMQRTAQSAADLAALAAAQHLIDGGDLVCSNARKVTILNNAELIQCTPSSSGVLVVVGKEVRSSAIHRVLPLVTATAKAGY
jgi:secretion/DNA translocation related TadE-like protein